MSELYLDLKRRIPLVAEWTDVGPEEMERAQARLGLSDERLAREIPISAKTWVRWKRRGQIPTHLLPRVAPLLGFELVPLEPVPIGVGGDGSATVENVVLIPPDLRESLATLVDLTRRQAEIAERVEVALGRIEESIAALVPAPRRARQRTSQ